MTYLERDGTAIFLDVVGTDTGRPPLLLSHGYAASAEMWKPNLDALGADRQVILWDMRGHGRSASPPDPDAYSEALAVADMAAVLDEVGVDQAICGGLSLGGYLSLAFALAHPQRVAALVLVDTGPGFRNAEGRQKWNRLASSIATSYERDGLAAMPDSAEVGAGPHDPVGLALAARGVLLRHDSRVIDALPAIEVPTLVVVGALDRPYLAAADHMAAKIPNARKVVLAAAGHAANIDQPTAFDTAVVDFLAQL